jgi:hypothetical protein
MRGILNVRFQPEHEPIELPVEAELAAANGRCTGRAAESDIRDRHRSGRK